MPTTIYGRRTLPRGKYLAAAKIQAAFRKTRSRPAPRAIQKKTVRLPTNSTYKLSKPMRSMIQDVIDGNAPDHWGMVLQGNQSCRWAADGASGTSLISLVPAIQQVAYDAGTIINDIQRDNLNSRSDKTIKLKYLRGKLDLYVKPETECYSGSTDAYPGDLLSAIYIRVLTLSCKNRKTFKQVKTDWNATLLPHLFLDQSTKAYSWTGQPENVRQPVNTVLFTVHQDQLVKLQRGSVVVRDFGTAPPGGIYQTHVPSMSKTFDIQVKCKNKIIHYDTGTDIYPTDFAPFVVVLYANYIIGMSPNDIQNTVNMHGQFKMCFEES